MTEGIYIEQLDRFLVVEFSNNKILRIHFSTEEPKTSSVLVQSIVDYLNGTAPCPKVDLDVSKLTNFQKKIYAIVRTIPRGCTISYGEVALHAAEPGAARAVGRAMAANPFAVVVPCHRVVGKHDLGGFLWGCDIKKKLLIMESSCI